MSNNLTAGLGIGWNRIEATGSNADGDILLRAKGNGEVRIDKGNLVLADNAPIVFKTKTYFPGSNPGIKIIPSGQSLFSIQQLTINASIVPDTTNTHSLGSGGGLLSNPIRWSRLYLVNAPDIASDRRLKENITNLSYGLKEVLALRPVSYYLKADELKKTKLGLIAQETKSIIPEIVSESEGADKMMGIQYSDLIPVLIKGMQEQQKLIEALKKQNDELNSTLSEIQSRIDILENENGSKASLK